MTYLVTGGTGLIGSRIVRDLIKEGQRVVVYDLVPDAGILKQLLSADEQSLTAIVQGDITDIPFLMRTVKENKVEKIIHTASLMGDIASANPPLALRVMCEGTLNIFEAARIFGLKVVWASSIAIFGSPQRHTGDVISNDAPHFPTGVYDSCKDLDEKMASHYFDKFGVDISSIRYTFVYGAGQVRGNVGAFVRELILNPAAGKPGKVPFGDDTMNWLYVDDAAHATVLASKVPRTKTRAFNVSGYIRSVKDVADYIRKLLPGADITLQPGVMGLGYKFETKQIEEELGFKPQWPVEKAVKDTINATRRSLGLPTV